MRSKSSFFSSSSFSLVHLDDLKSAFKLLISVFFPLKKKKLEQHIVLQPDPSGRPAALRHLLDDEMMMETSEIHLLFL